MENKIYKEFNAGDEVFTPKETYKAIKAYKPYIVLKFYKPPGFSESCPIRVIDIKTDGGYISRYSSDKFLKTPAQIRADKINKLINEG